jgi:hypothetical protein
MTSKAEALLQAVRETKVGSDIILHNPDMGVWCILTVRCKEHSEQEDDGGFVYPKGE